MTIRDIGDPVQAIYPESFETAMVVRETQERHCLCSIKCSARPRERPIAVWKFVGDKANAFRALLDVPDRHDGHTNIVLGYIAQDSIIEPIATSALTRVTVEPGGHAQVTVNVPDGNGLERDCARSCRPEVEDALHKLEERSLERTIEVERDDRESIQLERLTRGRAAGRSL